jgi:hypothetical protein
MSQNICEIVSPEAIQQNLINAFGKDNMIPDSVDALRFVVSPENTSVAAVTRVTGMASKVNPVKVVYDQRLLEDEGFDGRGTCTINQGECDLTKVYNFDTTDAFHNGFKVSPMELAGTAEENSAFVSRKLAKYVAWADQRAARKLAQVIAAQYGAWSQDTANIRGVNVAGNILNVNDYIGTSGEPNAVLFQQIRKAMMLTKIEGGVVAGGLALSDYADRAFSRNGAASGWDLGEMAARYGFAPVYDRYLTEELAAVNATNAAIGRGSVIPLIFNLFAEEFNRMNGSTNLANVLVSPYTGIPYDYKIHRACAEDPWNVIVTGTIDFVTMPDDMYKIGDNLEGTKSLALINVTCDDLTPCQD